MEQYKEETIKKYKEIISAEAEINHWRDISSLLEVEDLLNTTSQLLEIALSATVLRSYNNNYGMTEEKRAYESVSAHTNLMLALLDREIDFKTNAMTMEPLDLISYRAIMEAARRHDLPENVIGDIPDNGDRNDTEKAVSEHYYLLEFSKLSPKHSEYFEAIVSTLLDDMEKRLGTLGRSLYMADKTAAILMALVEDFNKSSPIMSKDNPKASQNDKDNMEICDYCENQFYRASEMWTVSFIKTRKMIQYDNTGFFTAIIILATLIVNGKWYKWRKKDYETTW